jgi:hypothetical protein
VGTQESSARIGAISSRRLRPVLKQKGRVCGQAVSLDFPYPDAKEGLNGWLPLVKWLLAIPQYILLAFLGIAAIVSVIIAWFAILFTGRYPRGLFDFVLGVMRWGNRVSGYAFILVTDQYPPFRLSP